MSEKLNKKPDFIGIGVMKAASTWIFRSLQEHPEICSCTKKEIRFFNTPYNYQKGINYYLSFFENCPDKKIKGEFTPFYILYPQVPLLIYKHFPDVKIMHV